MLTTLVPNVATQIPTSKTANTVVLNLSSTVSVQKCNSQEFGGNFAVLTIPRNGVYTVKPNETVWVKAISATQVWSEETNTSSYNLGTSQVLTSPTQLFGTTDSLLLVDGITQVLDIARNQSQQLDFNSPILLGGAALLDTFVIMITDPNQFLYSVLGSINLVFNLIGVGDSLGNIGITETDPTISSNTYTYDTFTNGFYPLVFTIKLSTPVLIGKFFSLHLSNCNLGNI